MDRKSANENFEHFLRQSADDFRMHPSLKVWDGISENLHKRKRKFYFGLVLLLISSSILGYTVLDLSFSKLTERTAPISTPSFSNNSSSLSNKDANQVKKKSGNDFVINQSTPKLKIKLTGVDAPVGENYGNSFAGSLAIERQSVIPELGINSSNQLLKDIPTNTLFQGLSSNKSLFDFNSSIPIPSENKNITEPAKQRLKSGKFSFMFFFTPTVSYRKLTENKSYLRSASPIGVPYNVAALYDINNAVTHKPNIGLEFGMTSKYSISKNIKLRAGLQFNLNRYDIKAFKYTPERATIALNNGSAGVQSVSTASNYRNFNGGQIDWLQNSYFQVSTPIGAEVKLHGNDKMYFGVASTIQPTYVLGERAYLITADYKNYAQVPWLMRHWNVNTNLETFVAYSTGKLKWQVGPQVRYQLLSSFANKYPVKENLFDFGLKVGISVNQNQ